MSSRARRILLGLVFLPLLVVVFSGWWAYRYRPVTAFEWKTRAELKWNGWTAFSLEGLTGLEQSFCESGKPCACVALVHGFCDNLATWKTMMDPGAAKWAGHQVVVFDLPGAGSTPLPRSKKDVGPSATAAQINRALKARCDKWTVVGNSLGGWIAAWMAIEDPKLIERVVLLSPAGMPRQSEVAFQKFVNPTQTSIKNFMRLAYAKPVPVPEFAWPDIVQSFKSCQDLGVGWEQGRQDTLEKRLARIQVPTTILWGTGDRLIDISAGEEMAAGIAGAKLIKVPDCGHLPQRECPAAVFDAIFPSRDNIR